METNFEDIFNFFQRTAIERGWPPTPIEVAKEFNLSTANAIEQCLAIRAKLDEYTATVEIPRQEEMAKVNVEPKKIKSVPRPQNISQFTGRNGWPNPHDRAIYYFYSALNAYHRKTVDYMFHDEMIAVVPETEAYLYGKEAAELPTYKAGSRPFLEQVAFETTKGCKNDREKALALIKLIANPINSPYRGNTMLYPRFLGGTEEEVLKKSWHMCNEISRSLSFLCQICGLPARPVFIFTDPVYFSHGHSQTEIFFDGKWNLVEQNHGLLYPKKDGYFASMVELRDDPSIVNSRKDVGGMLALSSCCFNSPMAIVQYRIDDVSRYNYLWQDKINLTYRTHGMDYTEVYGNCDFLDDSHR